MGGDRFALAIPAYNEEDGIAEFLTEIDSCFGQDAEAVSYVIVDDCSTDRTREVLDQLGTCLRGTLLVFGAESNRGHGPTTLDAYRRALDRKPEVVIQVDGDGQFEGTDVVRIGWSALSENRIVIGTRAMRVDPWFRRLLTRGLRGYLRMIFGVRSPDPNCPLRAFPAGMLAELIASVPEGALVPNIYLTVLCHSTRSVRYESIEHRARRGTDPEGTSWRGDRHRVVPVRLLRFSARALAETVRFRRGSKSWRTPTPD